MCELRAAVQAAVGCHCSHSIRDQKSSSKNFRWGLINQSIDQCHVSTVYRRCSGCGAERNLEILRGGYDYDRSERFRLEDMNLTSRHGNRNSGTGCDQRNRGSQQSRVPSEGYTHPVCKTCGRRHPGECRRAAG
ncbi:hypothetical protein Tco_0027244, partial [Tanacetum coccineum]